MKYLMIILMMFLLIGCIVKEAELGSAKNPIKMFFVPSMEADKIIVSGQKIADYLSQKTGYHFKVAVPTSYAAVIEAMGTKETDVAWLATFGYILAHEKFGAEVALTTVRKGLEKYRGQFIARTESGIEKLEDIEGKTIAYTDAASTSGYMYPSATLQKNGIKPAKYFFAGGHPQVVLSVYEGTADVGCTYWSPPAENGEIKDARKRILETHPDVIEKVKIVGFTEWIPNDTVTFRQNFPTEMKQQIVDALLEFAASEKGHEILIELLDIDGFVLADNADYDVVRETLKLLKIDVDEKIK